MHRLIDGEDGRSGQAMTDAKLHSNRVCSPNCDSLSQHHASRCSTRHCEDPGLGFVVPRPFIPLTCVKLGDTLLSLYTGMRRRCMVLRIAAYRPSALSQLG